MVNSEILAITTWFTWMILYETKIPLMQGNSVTGYPGNVPVSNFVKIRFFEYIHRVIMQIGNKCHKNVIFSFSIKLMESIVSKFFGSRKKISDTCDK